MAPGVSIGHGGTEEIRWTPESLSVWTLALQEHHHQARPPVIEKRIIAGQWFRSVGGALHTSQGYEAMHRIRKIGGRNFATECCPLTLDQVRFIIVDIAKHAFKKYFSAESFSCFTRRPALEYLGAAAD